METLTDKLIQEGGYTGHVLTTKLPKELDNSLYTLIHFIGGMDFKDIIIFANNATEEEINRLSELVNKFPNTIQDIMPIAGNYSVLRKTETYKQIIDIIKGEDKFSYITENLDKLIFVNKPSKKHKKRMERKGGVFSNFKIDKFKNNKPPKNSSKEAEKELFFLDTLPVIEKFIKNTDDIHTHFKTFFKTKKLNYPEEELEKILKDSSSILLKLKYHYNRPRPKQLAKEKGLKFHAERLKTSYTPSYPSGHAAQGRLLARILIDKFPKHESELMKLGNEIGTGRLVAKVHYPSDDLFGKEVGDALYKSMDKKLVKEDVDVGADGFYTTDTHPYFTQHISPKVKRRLFKHWDSLGAADYNSLKLFGVEDDTDDYGSDFKNVFEIIYPVLALEWIGGVDNTKFAKSGWKNTDEMGFEDLKFKVEPVGYDYMFDESVNFGDPGYACWHLRLLIDVNETSSLDTSDRLKELFPESAQNKLSSFHNYTDDQMYIIEGLWEYYYEEASEYWTQFCQVEVRLV